MRRALTWIALSMVGSTVALVNVAQDRPNMVVAVAATAWCLVAAAGATRDLVRICRDRRDAPR